MAAVVKLLLASLAFIVWAASASAQMHSTPPYSSLGGWGSVAFPGTGHPPSSGYVNAGRHAGQLGLLTGSPRPANYGYYRQQHPIYSYAYPVYVGGYSDAGYVAAESAYPAYPAGYPAAGYPAYGSAMGPPPAPAPTVIINQNFAAPAAPAEPAASAETVRVYSNSRQAADNAAPDPQYYLIALKDHSIYSAVAYWVEDGTLHYITTPNIRNQTSLDLVDMALTTRLNQDRGVSVSLPPAR